MFREKLNNYIPNFYVFEELDKFEATLGKEFDCVNSHLIVFYVLVLVKSTTGFL
jgi:hypothetical protein